MGECSALHCGETGRSDRQVIGGRGSERGFKWRHGKDGEEEGP